MRIGIASDHRGYDLKEKLKKSLSQYEVIDYGTMNSNRTDYPDYAFLVAEAVRDEKIQYGIAICGSGIGMSIACNKVKNIRCARVCNLEDAYISRIDNDANIISFSADISLEQAEKMVNTFLNTSFSNEERHKKRIEKIARYENEC